MAKSCVSPPLLFLYLLLLSGGTLKFAKGMETGNSWCVAKPSASLGELKANIEYACSELKDCRMIEAGGPCFYPNTDFNHASVVMNRYYAAAGRNTWNCNFSGSALIVITDPSYNGCIFA